MAFANERTHILSTEGMVDFARRSPKRRFVVATETGIIHRLEREVPEKEFVAAREAAVCRFMKMITLENARDALRDGVHRGHGRAGSRRPRPRRDRPHGRARLADAAPPAEVVTPWPLRLAASVRKLASVMEPTVNHSVATPRTAGQA